MAKAYPAVAPMRELRCALSDMRLADLAVGNDGRNRTLLSAFRSRTGRNQPSNTKFIFGPAVWLRSLIQPPPGYGLAYIDWGQQEYGIAAVLSGDCAMQAAYTSPAIRIWRLPSKPAPFPPTQRSKATTRNASCSSSAFWPWLFGHGGEIGLAQRIGPLPIVARDLLRAHRETYRTFWRMVRRRR